MEGCGECEGECVEGVDNIGMHERLVCVKYIKLCVSG